MQTRFSAEQLADPETASSNAILRSCVHCGFCTATCPTYVLLGDELDSPRGRIYQIQQMLETGEAPTANTVKHLDRCLSCQSCMTTCPSGVHYAHLMDHARVHVAKHYRRPWGERLLRGILLRLLTSRRAMRLALRLAHGLRPLARWAPRRLGSMLELGAGQRPQAGGSSNGGVYPAQGQRQLRVALLGGCAQGVLAPQINDAAVRVLNRNGIEVVVLPRAHCCGALAHHLGDTRSAQRLARGVMDGWRREMETRGLDAIVVTASGCGTMIKDYGFIFRDDPDWADCAKRISALARDIVEVLPAQQGDPARTHGVRVAYHSACSLQHGQLIDERPRELLRAAGFDVQQVPEGHLCCGSAGTYNLLQPELALQLRERKVAAIRRVAPDVIAAGNLGCLTQIAAGAEIPAVHTIELLDWAGGGPLPKNLPSRG
ncbi:MAG TPA: glycolate oxidase subunit GlcF [Steroidobacteraceae bacterium]|jgi:glycolate oxidase iron-sulfur subunit|nr:glycolate oxidase subunit GlcF [Steroidobacteraceae bacterium]